MKSILTIAVIAWLEMLRRKELYVLLILMGAFLGLMLSVDIFGITGITGHLREIGLLFIWICAWFMVINFSARQLPREEASGTIFTLLAKPVSRAQLLLGKWLGGWGAGIVAAAAFYLVFLIVIFTVSGGGLQPVVFLQHLMLHACFLGVLAALALLLSTSMNYDAAATLTYVLSISAYLILPQVPRLLMHSQGARLNLLLIMYYALPHLDLFDMRLRLAHNWEAADWRAVLMIIAYAVALITTFLLLAWILFRNRRFSRSARV